MKITGTPSAGGEVSVLTAKRGFFDYGANRIDFVGNVESKRGQAVLTCDRLELFLTAARNGKTAAVPGTVSGTNRTLKNAVASGNAVMNDGEKRLQSDRIEYFFVPAPANAKAQPGLFQSGSLRLTKVLCDGNVKLNNRKVSEPEITVAGTSGGKKKKSGAGVMLGSDSEFREISSGHLVSNFDTNTTVFTVNVSITDGSSRMDCEKLELFTRNAVPQSAGTAAAADIDADPFDLPAENSVPSVIAVGNGLELDRAVASDNVVIDRRDPLGKGNVKVFCERAFFASGMMTVECTGTPERRPRAESFGKTHEADKFILHLKDERLETVGGGTVE